MAGSRVRMDIFPDKVIALSNLHFVTYTIRAMRDCLKSVSSSSLLYSMTLSSFSYKYWFPPPRMLETKEVVFFFLVPAVVRLFLIVFVFVFGVVFVKALAAQGSHSRAIHNETFILVTTIATERNPLPVVATRWGIFVSSIGLVCCFGTSCRYRVALRWPLGSLLCG